jgi:hypothetical protein
VCNSNTLTVEETIKETDPAIPKTWMPL